MIQFILLLVGLIILFLLLAKVIVEYVPKKVHWIISLFLLFTAIYLGYKIYDGVVGNINFHKEKKARYAKVIERLKVIREAELAYKKVKGVYSKDFNELVNFIKTDSFAELRTLELSKEIEDRGVTRVIEYQKIDTIGFTRVLESFKDKDFENMMKVPGTDAIFELGVAEVEKGAAAIKTSVFEAKVSKRIVLEGMNKNLIDQEVSVQSVDQVRGSNISVGNLEDVKDSGNWPPSYDTSKESNAK
jgi:hypothetical protein